MRKVSPTNYIAPCTTMSSVMTEGCFCASGEKTADIKLKAEVDEYISIDDMNVTFE